jgi:chromate transporter
MPSGAPPADESASCSLRDLVLYFLRLGTFGFGGPIALAGYMQRDLVEERKWVSKQDYVDGLALAQLSPGPLAAQLAMYIGWARGGFVGATVVGFAFIAPSFLMVLGLAALYLRFGGLSWMQGAFYGVGAAVIAVIARSAVKLTKMTLARDPLLWALFGVSALTTAITRQEVVWLFLGSGALTLLVRTRKPSLGAMLVLPPALATGAHGVASSATLAQIAWFFTKAGAFVFGSGLAIVPFLYEGVVHEYAWLTERQFRDAVAVAMITPGPVVITAGFVGYLAGGLAGAVLAALGTFLPPFLVVVIAARWLRRAGPRVKAFVSGVTASATGAIAGAVFVLGRGALVDWVTIAIAAASFGVLSWTKRVPEPAIFLVAALAGLAAKSVLPR